MRIQKLFAVGLLTLLLGGCSSPEETLPSVTKPEAIPMTAPMFETDDKEGCDPVELKLASNQISADTRDIPCELDGAKRVAKDYFIAVNKGEDTTKYTQGLGNTSSDIKSTVFSSSSSVEVSKTEPNWLITATSSHVWITVKGEVDTGTVKLDYVQTYGVGLYDGSWKVDDVSTYSSVLK